MGLNKPLITEIAPDTWMVNEYGLANMYVLKGKERGLVVDIGLGYGGFPKIIQALIGHIPYQVVITHISPGHGDMLHLFPTVYVSDLEWNRIFGFTDPRYDRAVYTERKRKQIKESQV